MSWIKTIQYTEAKGVLKRSYDRVKGPNNNIDNVLAIHSLRPHTLSGHMTLYKAVLHNANNTLPKWYLEALGVYVSHLNNCSYCVDHHFAGFARLLDDEVRATQFLDCVKTDTVHKFFDEKYFLGSEYAKNITLNPSTISKQDVIALVSAGFSEGEVLEINQVSSYFNYVNRMVVSLGVNTDGDIIGLSPKDNDDPNNWNHS